jgi:hypothetical protein
MKLHIKIFNNNMSSNSIDWLQLIIIIKNS